MATEPRPEMAALQALPFEGVRFQVLERHEFQGGVVRCFQIDGGRDSAPERVSPTRDTKTPAITRLEPGKAPFRVGRNQVVAIENREIQKIARDLNTNRVQANVFRTGPAEAVSIKTRERVAAAGFQFCSENVRRHT